MAELFVGVWQRTRLDEPRGVLGPQEEQEKTVLWIQGQANLFIDLRIFQDRQIFNSLDLKSFSGEISYDNNESLMTWHRELDYRPLGPPDVGLIHFVSENEIEEDGVLPGDDFKEIWKRITTKNDASDVSAKISILNADDSLNRSGYFLIVGDTFALTLSRSHLPSDEEQRELDLKLKNYFAEQTELDDKTAGYLTEYVTIVGQVAGDASSGSDWTIRFALHKEMIGTSIANPEVCRHQALRSLLSSLSWETVHGEVPSIFATTWKNFH
jgi:hypothetical protein